MKTTIYLDNKKISKKTLIEKVGKERAERYIAEAKEGFMEDSGIEQSWWLGSIGMLVIEFN